VFCEAEGCGEGDDGVNIAVPELEGSIPELEGNIAELDGDRGAAVSS